MNQKIKVPKGFIRIPLLIAIISSVVLGSVVITGGVLIKQGKLKLTANVSEPIKQEQSSSPTIEPTIEPTTEPVKESPEPTKEKLAVKNTPTKPIVQTPTPRPIIISTPKPTQQPILQPVQQNTTDPDTQAQIDALRVEQERQAAEQLRQQKCFELTILGRQLQTLCGALVVPEIDTCLISLQSSLATIQNYLNPMLAVEENLRTDFQKSEINTLSFRIPELQSKIDGVNALKPQYDTLKAECGN